MEWHFSDVKLSDEGLRQIPLVKEAELVTDPRDSLLGGGLPLWNSLPREAT